MHKAGNVSMLTWHAEGSKVPYPTPENKTKNE
jgi:hypothetical protein